MTDALAGEIAALESALDHESSVYFMVESIKDIQETIRAIDTKVGILLAALAVTIPFVRDAIAAVHINGFAFDARHILGSIAIVILVIAAAVAIRALSGIDNAAAHIRTEAKPDNAFYAGGLFALRATDALFSRRSLQSRRSLEDFIGTMPRTFAMVEGHLAHEIMSVAYIRDVKLYRQRWAFRLTGIAGLLGLLSLVV